MTGNPLDARSLFTRRRAATGDRPSVEPLELRRLMSVAIKHHTLVVGPDDRRAPVTIVVGLAPGGHDVRVAIDGGPATLVPLAALTRGVTPLSPPHEWPRIRVSGGRGDDHLTIDAAGGPLTAVTLPDDPSVPPPAVGPNVVPLRVELRGGRGNDTLTGDGYLYGGPGDDTLVGTAAAATPGAGITAPGLLDGGPGNDVLDGGDGDETLVGGPGDDVLRGGAGADVLEPRGGGGDVVATGPGADTVYAGRRPNRRPGLVTDLAAEDRVVARDHPTPFSFGPTPWDFDFGIFDWF